MPESDTSAKTNDSESVDDQSQTLGSVTVPGLDQSTVKHDSAVGSVSTDNQLPDVGITGISDSTPLSTAGDFHTGIPLVTPTVGDGVDSAPDNEPANVITPLLASKAAKVTYRHEGEPAYAGLLNNGDTETTLYRNDDESNGIEIDAGIDSSGFFIDAFDGDGEMSYTMGDGYDWAAEAGIADGVDDEKTQQPEEKGESTSASQAETAPSSKTEAEPRSKAPSKSAKTSGLRPKSVSPAPDHKTVSDRKPDQKTGLPAILSHFLPRTGEQRTTWLFFLGLVILIAIAGLVVLVQKKRGQNR